MPRVQKEDKCGRSYNRLFATNAGPSRSGYENPLCGPSPDWECGGDHKQPRRRLCPGTASGNCLRQSWVGEQLQCPCQGFAAGFPSKSVRRSPWHRGCVLVASGDKIEASFRAVRDRPRSKPRAELHIAFPFPSPNSRTSFGYAVV